MMKIIVKVLPWNTKALIGTVPGVLRGKGELWPVPILLSICCFLTPFNICYLLGAIKINSFGFEYMKLTIIVGKIFSAAILDNVLINDIENGSIGF